MTLEEEYEKETEKSAYDFHNECYTDDFVYWLKSQVESASAKYAYLEDTNERLIRELTCAIEHEEAARKERDKYRDMAVKYGMAAIRLKTLGGVCCHLNGRFNDEHETDCVKPEIDRFITAEREKERGQ